MIHWLVQDALIVLALAASLWLFLSLKRELLKTQRRLIELARRVGEVESREPQTVVSPPAPRSGINLNKRVQALRMLRRGEEVPHIAAALGVPAGEVELLVRVQAMAK